MPTPLPSPQPASVLTVLSRFPDGATTEQIRDALNGAVPSGVLKYWLSTLEKSKRIRSENSGGILHYRLVPVVQDAAAKPAVPTPSATAIADPSVAPAAASAKPAPVGPPSVPEGPAASAMAQRRPVCPEAAAPTPPRSAAQCAAGNAATATAVATPSAPEMVHPPAPPATGPLAIPVTQTGMPEPEIETQFAGLFESVVFQIVTGAHTRVSSIALLQQYAIEQFRRLTDRRAFVSYAKSRLETFTSADAAEYGIEPEQYQTWRGQYWQRRGHDSEAPQAEDPGRKPESANSAAKTHATSPSARLVVTPRGLAKALVKWVEPFVPQALRPWVQLLLVTLSAALIAPALALITGHPWFTVALVGVILGGVLLAGAGYGRKCGKVEKEEGGKWEEPGSGAPEAGGAGDLDSPPVRSRRRVWLVAAGTTVLVGLLAAAGAWRSALRHPSAGAVQAYLTAVVAPLHARVATLELIYGQPAATGCTVTFKAVVETTEPRYRRIDVTDYLRTHASVELAAIETANVLLGGPTGHRLRAALAAPAPVPGIRDLVLLTVQTPPGAATVCSGTLVAWRQDGAWKFAGEKGALDQLRFPGDPIAMNPAVFAIDMPSDSSRLQSLLAAHVAYAAKVQAAAAALAASTGSGAASSASKSTPAASLPQYPGLSGAHVLIAGRWVPLPRNNGRQVRSVVEALTGALGTLRTLEDSAAGSKGQPPTDFVAEVSFDGRETVPTVHGNEVLIVFVGTLEPLTGQQLARYPELRSYPLMELAGARTVAGGERRAPLFLVAPGVVAFGPARIAATVEQPGGGVTLLRCTEPLQPGRYALSCGPQYYELMVE